MRDSVRSTGMFLVGVAVTAVTVGILTGISASPVVSVLIPLMFGLISVGGVAFATRNSSDESEVDTGQASRVFAGWQMLCFSVPFMAGLWFGVAAKLHLVTLWPASKNAQPAFTSINYDDLVLLRAAIELDNRMRASGVPYAARCAVFKKLDSAVKQRSSPTDKGLLAKSDDSAARVVLQVPEKHEGIFEFPVVAMTDKRSFDSGS